MSAVLQADRIFCGYGRRTILRGVSLHVAAGEVLAVIGPNGSGKTTLMKALAGVHRVDRGLLSGPEGSLLSRAGRAAHRREATLVFQRPYLFSGTVRRNVEAGLRWRGMEGVECHASAERWMERLGILPLAEEPVPTLSGGQQRRVALARALVLQPKILLLDEPFADLDIPARRRLIADLRDLIGVERERRMAVVLVLHDPNDLLRIADRVLALDDGTAVQCAGVEEMRRAPAADWIRDYFTEAD